MVKVVYSKLSYTYCKMNKLKNQTNSENTISDSWELQRVYALLIGNVKTLKTK